MKTQIKTAIALLITSLFLGSFINELNAQSLRYQVHCQSDGWKPWAANGESTGNSKRIEAIKIIVDGMPGVSVRYRVHCQSYGWMDWKSDGQMAGTTGEWKRLEAIEIKLVDQNGLDLPGYSVCYEVDGGNYKNGWNFINNACDGNRAGSTGDQNPLHYIRIWIQ